jgi:hypothetical protein
MFVILTPNSGPHIRYYAALPVLADGHTGRVKSGQRNASRFDQIGKHISYILAIKETVPHKVYKVKESIFYMSHIVLNVDERYVRVAATTSLHMCSYNVTQKSFESSCLKIVFELSI